MALRKLTNEEKAICELYVLGYTISLPAKITDYAAVGKPARAYTHFRDVKRDKSHNKTTRFFSMKPVAEYLEQLTITHPTTVTDAFNALKSRIIDDLTSGRPIEVYRHQSGDIITTTSKYSHAGALEIIQRMSAIQAQQMEIINARQNNNNNNLAGWFEQENERSTERSADDLQQVLTPEDADPAPGAQDGN